MEDGPGGGHAASRAAARRASSATCSASPASSTSRGVRPPSSGCRDIRAIAAVVVGGTLLTGGVGSVGSTLAGVLLLGMIFNILNFENGLGWISLSAYWQSVIRGAFLLLVVAIQARLSMRTEEAA